MAYQFEDVYFSWDSFDVGNIDDLFFDEYLDGHFLAGKGVGGEFDLAEGALSDGLAEEVVPYLFLFFVVFSHSNL